MSPVPQPKNVWSMTAQIGTFGSQPGQVQPGYFLNQGVAVWRGPYVIPPLLQGLVSTAGQISGVTVALAAQLAAADSSWWEFH